jgi:hypothetical protein
MNLSALLPGLLLGFVALFIIFYCLWLFFLSLSVTEWGAGREKKKLTQKMERLAKARELLQSGNYRECHPLLKQAFMLDALSGPSDVAERVLEHHLAVLGVLLSLSEKHPVPLSNLPGIEELLQTRASMSKAELDLAATIKKLKTRGEERLSGKGAPGWALKEFSKKRRELQQKLEVNRKSLQLEIDKLFACIGQRTEPEEVTYH